MDTEVNPKSLIRGGLSTKKTVLEEIGWSPSNEVYAVANKSTEFQKWIKKRVFQEKLSNSFLPTLP